MRKQLARVLTAAIVATSGCRGPDSQEPAPGATLGVVTSVPSDGLARQLDLPFSVRRQGRVADSVEPGSPADRAGIRAGDVLLALDGHALYSQDDIDDFLAASMRGREARVEIRRPGDPSTRVLVADLGPSRAESAPEPRLSWHYAGLAQLPRALEEARARKKKVMVGLSGAET